jgi:hypothetical protein
MHLHHVHASTHLLEENLRAIIDMLMQDQKSCPCRALISFFSRLLFSIGSLMSIMRDGDEFFSRSSALNHLILWDIFSDAMHLTIIVN